MTHSTAPHDDGDGSPERAFRISGRVQGVGFRWWTRKTADSLGIRGSVRNLPDGTVEIRARGTSEALSALEERLGAGPSGARVREVTRVDSDLPLPRSGFEIVR